jgi:CRISPR system Cascade subunit CasE
VYLSRLILNPRSRRVQREVADSYQMHRSIMRAFPSELSAGQERVLFRLESSPRNGTLILLVQSRSTPDWCWLAQSNARGYLLPVSEPNPAMKVFELDPSIGQALAFRLRANPTARRRLSDGKGKRIGLQREEEQVAWLHRKAQEGGFRVLSVRTGNQDTVTGFMRRNGTPHKLSLLSVQFDGLLRVSDPDRMRKSVYQGIGSGKAFGFGLLSLARPPA